MADQLSHELDCELVIGLVAAVGAEFGQTTNLLSQQLELAGYESEVIRISDEVIPRLASVTNGTQNKYDRYMALMTAGNNARKAACKISDNGDAALAYGVAAHIFSRRNQENGEGRVLPAGKKAFIIRSLKRPEEVEALRLIYPQGFVLIGIHAEEERRKNHLIKDLGMTEEEAGKLIDRDGEESKEKHGQRVNRTFHLADFFVHASGNNDRLKGDILRMVELWFGSPFHTPTFD